MKPVIQEDKTGCGLASVATIAGVTYPQIKKIARQEGIEVHDSQLWSEITYIRRLLTHYGIKTSRNQSPFISWEKLPPLALLAIKWHQEQGKPCWHWTVFHRSSNGPVVLDPKRELRTNTRTDFGRMKPKWFLKVISASQD